MLSAAASAVVAAEEETGGGLDLLLPAIPELIAGIIAFAIVFFFMWRWAFPAINRALENRQQAISGQLQEAEARKTEAQSLLEDYRAQLAEAKSEANRIIEEARSQAESVRSDLVAKAQAEAEQIVAKAREEAASEKSRALQEAQREVAALSVNLAERVVGESLDGDRQRALVDRYLAELERMAE